MSNSQQGLFPDDDLPAVVPLGIAGSERVLTAAQKRFNKLIGEIERARAELAEWQEALAEAQASAAAALPPRRAELRQLQRRMVMQLDELLRGVGAAKPRLTRRRRDAVRNALTELVVGMLEEEHDDELAALHDRHADLSLAEQAQFDADIARELFGRMLGDDVLPDAADASLDEVLHAAHEHMSERARAEQEQARRKAHKRAERRRARGSGPDRQEKLARAREEAGQSLRAVFRKLASALHPDRATDAADQTRRHALMQRANQAYEAQDLLALLSLQIELEQIDAAHLAGLADERVQHYNLVLQEQLDALRGEIRDCLGRVGLVRRGQQAPRELLRQALAADLDGIEQACRQLRADLAAFDEPARRLAVIDGWVAAERDAGAVDDFDIAMLDAFLQAPPPRRRSRRR